MIISYKQISNAFEKIPDWAASIVTFTRPESTDLIEELSECYELEKERQVIFEEMKMYHDNPRLYVLNEIQKFLFEVFWKSKSMKSRAPFASCC